MAAALPQWLWKQLPCCTVSGWRALPNQHSGAWMGQLWFKPAFNGGAAASIL